MSAVQWWCHKCSTPNHLWREQCRSCADWYKGTEETGKPQRTPGDKSSGSSSRSNSKARRNQQKINYGKLATELAKAMEKKAKASGAPGDKADDKTQTGEVKPTSAAAAPRPSQKNNPSSQSNSGNKNCEEDGSNPVVKAIDEEIRRKKAAILALESGGEQGTPVLVQLQFELQQAEQRKNDFKPLTTRIEEKTGEVAELREQWDDIDAKITKLADEKILLEDKLMRAKTELDALQATHHNQQAEKRKQEEQDKRKTQATEELLQLAVARGDRELYKIVTGRDMPEESGSANFGGSLELPLPSPSLQPPQPSQASATNPSATAQSSMMRPFGGKKARENKQNGQQDGAQGVKTDNKRDSNVPVINLEEEVFQEATIKQEMP
eukprot:TRINITY_DN70869_c0_g1_i1.p2 TRINITY_DN70869_c0_g1~~TRINITY_DN70869_c0_g1_i1.p2  ORF type:complete len:381 (+),score=121.06 TRINITY_DN70869_c0_g1_i1:423-1565(+)